jgi:hypothetical protein
VAFAGPSGAGKSTLAAYFQHNGYAVLADDLCAVSFDSAGRPWAWPGLRRIRLWQDALTAFGHGTAGLERVLDGVEKFHFALDGGGTAEPVPFRALYVLDSASAPGGAQIEHLRGNAAFRAALSQIYRRETLATMGLAATSFSRIDALVHHAAVYRVRRRWGFDVFDAEAERIKLHLGAWDRTSAPIPED